MSDIKLLIEQKKTNEDKLINVFVNYCGKYIRKIYNSLPDDKIFLKNLVEISTWNDAKKEKEYIKFLNWCNKMLKIDEHELNNLLYTTLYLSIEIIVYNYDYSEFIDSINFINTCDFFYKSMKSTSRFYYENLKKISANDKSKTELTEVISLQIHKAMPLKKILKFIQESEENNPFVIKYKSKQHITSDYESPKKLNIEKLQESSNKTFSSKSARSSSKSSRSSSKSSRSSSKSSRSSSKSARSSSKSARSSSKSSGSSSKSNGESSSNSSSKSSSKSSGESRSENSSIEKLAYININNFKKKNYEQNSVKKEKYDNIKHISLKGKKKF